jgi:hypothetical protein
VFRGYVLLAFAAIAVAGCGSSDDGNSQSGKTVTHVVTQQVLASPTATTATVGADASDKAKLTRCYRALGVTINPDGSAPVTKGRIPIVPVSAEYLGAAVAPNGAVADIWLAPDSESADKAAKSLNAALSAKLGSVAEGAEARGKVVAALANSGPLFGLSVAKGLDDCSDSLG